MNVVGLVSYGIAALAFVSLAILLTISWHGRRPGAYLIAASALTALWAVVLAMVAGRSMPVFLVYVAEMLRNAAWLLALASIAGAIAPRPLLIATRLVCAVALGSSLLIPAASGVGIDPLLMLSRAGLLMSLIGLILIEQIYRNSNESGRAALRYLAIGIGGLFAYDLFMYSQAELLRRITEETWSARGVLNALAVPLIAIAARRSPQWSLEIFVSRQVVFYTTTFIGVGMYLLLMGIGGYYVREIGGGWGRVGQIVFFAGAIVVLATLIASATLRRHARVFISKHFYRNKYDYRIEWLRFIGTLSSGDEPDVTRTAIRAIAQIFSSGTGMLFTRDEPGGRFVAAAAWPMRLDEVPGIQDIPVTDELPRFLARTGWIIDLQEYRRVPDIYENVSLPDWVLTNREVRLVSPLLQLDRLVGFVLLHEPAAPFELTYEDRDLLKTVGRHVATHLAQHEADRKLAEVGQFEAYNRLTAFLMHDLKNSVAQLKLVVANAARHKHNPQFIDDAIDTITNTVERMTRLIEQLGRGSAESRLSVVALDELARAAVARCSDRMPAPTLNAVSRAVKVSADPERLTAIIEHLIRNAQDASEASGSIGVEVRHDVRTASLSVTDTGCGMAADFIRERLFRPFDSTKGSKGMGIGAYQVREYVRTLGGQVEVQSSTGSGTRFSITLPLFPPAAPAADAGHSLERATS